MRADRVLARACRLDLLLLGERQPVDLGEATHRLRRAEPCGAQLLAVEARALEQVLELSPVCPIGDAELLAPRARLDLRSQHHFGDPGSGAIACSGPS